jgi:hypothetical protein
MVYLTSINILDTGFATKAKDTTQLATAYRVNSGAALQLKGVNFEISSSANLDKASFATNTAQTTVPFIGVNPRTFTLTLFLNSRNTDTNNTYEVNDVALLAEILRLPETYGVKALYYPVHITATPDDRRMSSQLVYQIGAADTTETQGDISLTIWGGSSQLTTQNLTDVRYISCRFESCSITQDPGSGIKVTLDGVWTV